MEQNQKHCEHNCWVYPYPTVKHTAYEDRELASQQDTFMYSHETQSKRTCSLEPNCHKPFKTIRTGPISRRMRSPLLWDDFVCHSPVLIRVVLRLNQCMPTVISPSTLQWHSPFAEILNQNVALSLVVLELPCLCCAVQMYGYTGSSPSRCADTAGPNELSAIVASWAR